MSKNSSTPKNNYTNNNMLKNISNVNRIYHVRNNNYENNVIKIIDKCIVNYDSKKKIVIQNIISNHLNNLTLTQQDFDIINYIINKIINSSDIGVLKISIIYFIIDKLFMYNNGDELRQNLINLLNMHSNKDKNIKKYLSIYLKTLGLKNNINIEKLEKCVYIQSKTDDSIIFEIVAFMKVNNIRCIVLYGKKGEKSLIEVKPLETIEDDFKKYISSNVKIEKFDINKALIDKMVSGTEIKAPIRKFTGRVNNKNTEVYYIYKKNTDYKYQLYNDKDCKNNYDPSKCGDNETSLTVEKGPNNTTPSIVSASSPSPVSASSLSSSSIPSPVPASLLNTLNKSNLFKRQKNLHKNKNNNKSSSPVLSLTTSSSGTSSPSKSLSNI